MAKEEYVYSVVWDSIPTCRAVTAYQAAADGCAERGVVLECVRWNDKFQLALKHHLGESCEARSMRAAVDRRAVASPWTVRTGRLVLMAELDRRSVRMNAHA